MQKYLDVFPGRRASAPEWKELLRDLDRLQQVRLQYRGAIGWCAHGTRAPTTTGLVVRQASARCRREPDKPPPPKAMAPSKPARKRRGRPKRSATPLRISP